MDAKLATTEIRMKNWLATISDRKASGLTVDDYCDQHNLSRNAYYYWLRKIKLSVLAQSGVSFVEISQTGKAPAECTAFRPQLTIQFGCAVIGIDEKTPKALLSMACEVISGAQ